MNLRIRTLLPLVVCALALIAVGLAGLGVRDALQRGAQSEAFLEVNQIARALLRSSGQWATERGIINSTLKAPEAAGVARLGEIKALREAGDQSLRQALELLRAQAQTKATAAVIADAEQMHRALQAVRGKIDQELGKPMNVRATEVVQGAFAQITLAIETSAKLRQTLETLSSPPSAALARLVMLRHLTADMAEYAGRERGYLGGIISARAKLGSEQLRNLSMFRGHIDLAWSMVAALKQRVDTPAAVSDAIDGVAKEYYGVYNAVREQIFASGERGDYALSADEYFKRATVAVGHILRLAEAIGGAADEEAANDAARSSAAVNLNGGVLAAALLLVIVSLWLTFARILRPLSTLTTAMRGLAAGDLTVALPGLRRTDEIGEMAQAVDACRRHVQARAREEIEAKTADDERIAAQRRKDMHRLAEGFESAVGEIVETVASASTELEASAATLTSTAERAEELTTLVAAASEEASTNVQSVASATEEMASSVNEISRQVQDSARIAGEAVEQAQKTNDRVGELAKAAARIGDVIELINTIAGQTNLLALNATIEAARAGDAGRGFAVVASEVKALAEQTAKATGDISAQINGIQAATQESVTAIREIGETIARMSEIASTIASAVEEQGAATQEISRNVQQAAQGTQQVSANITEVQRGASETGSASSQVLTAATSLSSESARLKLEVSKFLDSVRAA
ncbi:methyl-accepting chemotaxis protein [Rhodopseudomonas sp. P2A-2r]|uniref:methyl-accepting chemotaxis protein n=1 Tax=Rhodopseudomonas sp. P2A-2r TaxID=2991972 RepID=UPI00223418C5|nr:methyl-accepting chemotaxis protein [Rhodopseudomonas sp. P2A-2r]UZE48196.1 methyl-accepting chemotaxis protein [Rhodopseudomonas sp. P2A-2r]